MSLSLRHSTLTVFLWPKSILGGVRGGTHRAAKAQLGSHFTGTRRLLRLSFPFLSFLSLCFPFLLQPLFLSPVFIHRPQTSPSSSSSSSTFSSCSSFFFPASPSPPQAFGGMLSMYRRGGGLGMSVDVTCNVRSAASSSIGQRFGWYDWAQAKAPCFDKEKCHSRIPHLTSLIFLLPYSRNAFLTA